MSNQKRKHISSGIKSLDIHAGSLFNRIQLSNGRRLCTAADYENNKVNYYFKHIYGTSKLAYYPLDNSLGEYVGIGCYLSHNYVMTPFHCLEEGIKGFIHKEEGLDFAIISVDEECFPTCFPCTVTGNITLFAGIDKWNVLDLCMKNEICAEVVLSEELQYGDSGMIVYGEGKITNTLVQNSAVVNGQIPLYSIIARRKDNHNIGLAVSLLYVLNYIIFKVANETNEERYKKSRHNEEHKSESLAEIFQNLYGSLWDQWEFISRDYPPRLIKHVNETYTAIDREELLQSYIDKSVLDRLKSFINGNPTKLNNFCVLEQLANKYTTTKAEKKKLIEKIIIEEGLKFIANIPKRKKLVKNKIIIEPKTADEIIEYLQVYLADKYNGYEQKVNKIIEEMWDSKKVNAKPKLKNRLIQLYKIFHIAKLDIHDTDSNIADTDHCWVLEFEQEHSTSTGLYKLVSDFMEACDITNIITDKNRNASIYVDSSRSLSMDQVYYDQFNKKIIRNNKSIDNTACHHPFLCELTKACRGLQLKKKKKKVKTEEEEEEEEKEEENEDDSTDKTYTTTPIITHCCIRPSHLVKLNKKFNDYCTILQDFYDISDNLNVSWNKPDVKQNEEETTEAV